MEDSNAQDKILNFGKAIVKELDLDPGIDTLSKWIAHYVAEKIMFLDRLTGNKKAQAEKDCFEAILKLWEHRWSIPREKPFLQDFESLFVTLNKLNPNIDTAFFLPPQFIFDMEQEIKGSKSIQMDNESENSLDEDVNPQTYLDTALKVDEIAKSLLADLLNRAVSGLNLTSEREELIRNSIEAIDYPESRIITIISDYNNYLEIQKENTDEINKIISKINSRIRDLEDFTSIIKSLINSYNKELLKIQLKRKS